MKIVQFAASTGYGGMEKVFADLSNGLAEDHDITAFLLRDCDYRDRFSEKVKVVELRSNPTKHNPVLYWELYRKLAAIKPDIVHTHAAKGTLLAKRICKLLGIRHVGTKHNDRKGRVFDSLGSIVGVSEKVMASINLQPGAMSEVIYNAITKQDVKPCSKDEKFTILAVGRLDKIKGFDLLIHQLKKLTFPCRLLVTGEGPELGALINMVKELQLQQSVFFLGFREDVRQLMHDSHTVVMSSHREGCSNVMVEALFYAPVLLSTPTGAASEILPQQFLSSQSGLAEKITDLYNNYAEYTNQFELVRREKKDLFQFLNMIEKHEVFYQRIIGA